MKNSTHQNNRLFSALKHAIAAGVLITLSTAGTAQMQPEIGENQNVAQSIDITKPAYPSNQKLFELYQAMVKSGDVAEALIPPTEDDEAFLQRNFDFALNSELIGKYTSLLAQPATQNKPKSLLSCLETVAACTVGIGGTDLACFSVIPASGPIAAGVIATCAAVLSAETALCGVELRRNCKGVGDGKAESEIHLSLGPVGFEVAAKKNDFCAAGMRIRGFGAKFFVRDNLKKLGKFTALCSDGEKMEYGVNNGTNESPIGGCPNGYLVQGVVVTATRGSGHITSIRPKCDRVGVASGTNDHVWLQTFGAPNNNDVSTTLDCPEHRYLFGIQAFRSRDSTSQSVINSFKAHCK